ncbi:MAG: NAD(P)-dependent oxidoreductase [Planctomycetota bacterium JB042]
MRVVLWGPSEHVTDEERAALAERLGRRGAAVSERARDERPPPETEVVVCNTKTRLDAAALEALPALRLVVTTTSGHDHVDLAAAAARGVAVARCPIARRDAVVQTSIAMALALLHRLPRYSADAAAGRWARAAARERAPTLLSSLRVGVVGHGVIGARAVGAWSALGADVVATDPADPALPTFEAIRADVDVVTLHCSLTKSSDRLIDAAAVRSMREGAILVNTARGECVDLEAALSGRLGGVGLDVFPVEPPPDLAALAARDDVILTPHSAGVHAGLGAALLDEAEAAIGAFLDGRPVPHLVPAPPG